MVPENGNEGNPQLENKSSCNTIQIFECCIIDPLGMSFTKQNFAVYVCSVVSKSQSNYVVLLFYGLSTHFRSFRVQSVYLSTLSLGKPPRQFTNT